MNRRYDTQEGTKPGLPYLYRFAAVTLSVLLLVPLYSVSGLVTLTRELCPHHQTRRCSCPGRHAGGHDGSGHGAGAHLQATLQEGASAVITVGAPAPSSCRTAGLHEGPRFCGCDHNAGSTAARMLNVGKYFVERSPAAPRPRCGNRRFVILPDTFGTTPGWDIFHPPRLLA